MAEISIARARPSASSRFPGLVITKLVFTDTKLGRGADATVYEVIWHETPCAAKRLHEILLEDDSPGGSERFISNFEEECVTWSKLRHPCVVQFLGVYFDRNSRLPVLVMEKLDTSLRRYCEDHSKEEFPLHLKAFALRQVSQALAYLHGQNPPLVHHDLSSNNVLLNVESFVAKVTDFGMSRAISPSAITRKSSIKGTVAFMAPEALQNPPRYNEKLDVFSFGNLILSTVTHQWPEPDPPTKYQRDKIVGLTELQRRERYVAIFAPLEKQLLLPTVRGCLENRPEKRPDSVKLVRELRDIESAIKKTGQVAAPFDVLRQQLAVKQEECREKDEALKEKDETLKEKDEALREMDEALREKNEALREKDEMIQGKDQVNKGMEEALQHLDAIIHEQEEALTVKDSTIQAQQAEVQQLNNQLAALQAKLPLRDWKKLGKCQKVIQHSSGGGWYKAVAVSSNGLLAVADYGNKCVHLLTATGALERSIGKGELGVGLFGLTFDLEGNIWVADWGNNRVVKLSQDGRLLRTVQNAGNKGDYLCNPTSVCVSPEGLLYICDRNNHRVTVHDEGGRFLFAFGSKGSGVREFDKPRDLAFGSNGLVYVVDDENGIVTVWSKGGTFEKDFKPKYVPHSIAATSDGHLLITTFLCHNVMVCTLEGELIHQFGAKGSDLGEFHEIWDITVGDNGMVYVADAGNYRVQVL